MSDEKKQAIEHYNRMIAWAKKQDQTSRALMAIMRAAINENWSGKYCSYCEIYSSTFFCTPCPLGRADSCCSGLWICMGASGTWGGWIAEAEKVLEYIKENG